MKIRVVALFVLFAFRAGADLHAADRGKLIFEDDFQRTESQEITEEIGNGWSTNSKSRAAGNKQVDLRDGAMHIYLHKAADHAVSVRHDAEFQDGRVELRLMLEDRKDALRLDFADLKLKTVHAGHLFNVMIRANRLEIADTKTGVMNDKIHALKKAKKLTLEIKELLKTKKKNFPVKLETAKWYDLSVTISGETVTVSIDGQQAGSFTSSGFAHPTKRMLRLSVPKQAVVDNLKIFAASIE